MKQEGMHKPSAGEAAVIIQAGLDPYQYDVIGEDWQFLRLRKWKTGENVTIDKERRMVAHEKSALMVCRPIRATTKENDE